MLPSKQDLNIQLGSRFALRKPGIQHRQVSDRAKLDTDRVGRRTRRL
jgi:hypothetical protein